MSTNNQLKEIRLLLKKALDELEQEKIQNKAALAQIEKLTSEIKTHSENIKVINDYFTEKKANDRKNHWLPKPSHLTLTVIQGVLALLIGISVKYS